MPRSQIRLKLTQFLPDLIFARKDVYLLKLIEMTEVCSGPFKVVHLFDATVVNSHVTLHTTSSQPLSSHRRSELAVVRLQHPHRCAHLPCQRVYICFCKQFQRSVGVAQAV